MECCVCFSDFEPSAEGLRCSEGASGHFLCKSCAEGYVRVEGSPENVAKLVKNRGKLLCPGYTSDGQPCPASGYAVGTLARLLSESVFDIWDKARVRATEQCVAEEVRKSHQDELERLKARADSNAESGTSNAAMQERIRMKREHIIEKLLTLRCPNPGCEVAFVDFEGCMALKCNACGTGFCAFCLANCGRDAHAHLASCSEGRIKGGYHATFEQFEKIQRRRRLRLVGEYLDKIQSDEERSKVLESVMSDLKDLKIDVKLLRTRGLAAAKAKPSPKHGSRGAPIVPRRMGQVPWNPPPHHRLPHAAAGFQVPGILADMFPEDPVLPPEFHELVRRRQAVAARPERRADLDNIPGARHDIEQLEQQMLDQAMQRSLRDRRPQAVAAARANPPRPRTSGTIDLVDPSGGAGSSGAAVGRAKPQEVINLCGESPPTSSSRKSVPQRPEASNSRPSRKGKEPVWALDESGTSTHSSLHNYSSTSRKSCGSESSRAKRKYAAADEVIVIDE